MDVGVHLHPPPRQTADDFIRSVRTADELGLERVGVSDAPAQAMDVWAALALAAGASRRVELGPRVSNPVTRHVGVTAAGLAGTQLLTEGRAMIVIGRGDGGVINLGLRPASVDDVRRYVVALRALLTEGVATVDGRECRFRWPERDRVPVPRVYVAAEGPRMLRMAGEVADGVLVGLGLTPDLVDQATALITRGARSAGRDPGDLDIWWAARVAIDTDQAAARSYLKAGISAQAGHALAVPTSAGSVPESQQDAVRRYIATYDYAEKGKINGRNVRSMDELGLTDQLIERFGLYGTPDEIRARLLEYQASGIDRLWLNSPGGVDKLRMLGDALP